MDRTTATQTRDTGPNGPETQVPGEIRRLRLASRPALQTFPGWHGG